MPDKKITDLVDGDPLQPTDEFVVARAGDNFKIDGAAVVSAVTKHDVTLAGNTAGALALISSGTMTLAGGNNITVSQAGNGVTISGANAGGAQTGISGIVASNATYTSGTVTFTGSQAVTVRSGVGQQVIIDVPVQSIQPETQTFIAGVSASDTLYTSGNVRISGSNAVTVKSGTGQLVVIDVPVQSIQAETQTFIGGISASDTLYTSGTVRITGVGGGVTVSSNTGQRIDISVAAQSIQPETQTFIGGISASDTLYTSGSVRFTGVGGGITVSSNTGQRVDLSVAAPVAQTNQSGNLYASSNTFGTSSGTYDARSLSIAGSGNVSVAASNSGWVVSVPAQTNQAGTVYASSNTFGTSSGTYDARSISIAGRGAVSVAASNSGWIISAPTQTTQVETQTFVGGIVGSNATYTSGTVTFTGVGGGVTVSSNTGQRVDISVAAPVAQTNQSGNVYASSNTFGTSSGTYDARSLSIAGSGNVSVAASNSGWVISVPASAAQTNQSGNVYASSNTFGTSSGTYDARSLSIAGSGAVSVAASNSGWVVSAPAQTVQTQGGFISAGVSTGGNTAGNTQVSTGTRLVFVGSDMVSLSQATAAGASTITIDATNQNLSIGVSTGGNTAGNTTVNTGSRFVIVGSNGITASAGTAAGATTITLSGVTTAAQTNQSGNVYASSNTFGTSSGTYDARSLSIAGSGNVSIAASNSGWVVSVPAQTNQSGNVYASSNTFGTSSGTYDARSLSIAGSGAVSVAASNSGWVVSAPTQSVQTQGILNVALSTGGNTLGDTGINSGTRLVLAGGNNITLSGSSAANASTITIIGPTPGAAQFSVGVSTGGNTTGNTGVTGTRIVFAGSSPVSLSQATDATGATISIQAPATSSLSATGIVSLSTNGSTVSIGAAAYSGGMSTNGNTSGDTGYASQRLNLIGGNNITLSGSTNAGSMSITISAGAGGAGGIRGGVSTGGNTAGSTGTVSTGNMVLVGVSPVSLSQSTGAAGSDATVSILAPATSLISGTGQVSISTNGSTISVGVPNPIQSYREPGGPLLMAATQGIGASNANGTQTTVTAWVMPISLPNDLVFNNLFLAANNSFSSATTSISSINYSYSMGASLGFYTLNSSSMSLVTSFSGSLGFTNATSANATDLKATANIGIGGSNQGISITGAANMTSIMSSISGVRKVALNYSTISNTLTRGQYFAVACFSQLTGGNAQASLTSVGFVSASSIMGSAINPPALGKSTASVTSPYPFLGQATLINATNSLLPGSFNTSNITTATAIANSTKFQSIWMQIYSSHSD